MNLLRMLAVVATLSLTGCMTYSHNQLAAVEQWPLAAAEKAKPSTYVKVQAEYAFNGTPSPSNANLERLETIVKDTFVSSDRFGRVTTQQERSDLYVTATLKNEEEGSQALAVISGLTLMVLPATADNTLTLELAFRSGEDQLLGKVAVQEKITTWMHVLLIFALPFNPSVDELLTRMTQSALEEAVRQGLI